MNTDFRKPLPGTKLDWFDASAAVEALAEIATDPSAPAADRIQAARAILEAARPNAVQPTC